VSSCAEIMPNFASFQAEVAGIIARLWRRNFDK